MDISGQQCKISSWRSSRFVMWVPPNHLLNPIRLLFILLWGAVSIFFLEEGKQIHISSGCPSRDIWTVGQPWMWQTGPAKLGGDHHRCHRAANLHQVWVGNHHQTVAEAHRPVVGAGSGPPLGLHRRQVLPSQTQPCATARKGAHPGGVSAWKFHRYAALLVKHWTCQCTTILMTGTPVRHRDPPGVERGEGGEGDQLEGDENREEKKDQWNGTVSNNAKFVLYPKWWTELCSPSIPLGYLLLPL